MKAKAMKHKSVKGFNEDKKENKICVSHRHDVTSGDP
jgi:hypothetical protein